MYLQTDSAILSPVRSDEKADQADMRLNRLRHEETTEATLELALALALAHVSKAGFVEAFL